MKSFLVQKKKPLVKWSLVPSGIMFIGKVPEGYDLGIVPEGDYIVVDVDRHGDKDGFDHIPKDILSELDKTFHYKTKNNGMHYWLRYTGDKRLPNKTSGLGIDLRCRGIGYVVWYQEKPIDNYMDKINKTSLNMNNWLETVFCYVKKK